MADSTQTSEQARPGGEQGARSRFSAGAQRPAGGDRPGSDRDRGDRGDRPGGDRPGGDRGDRGERGERRGGGRGGFGGGRGRGRKEPIFAPDDVVDYKDVQRLRRCLDERGKISNRRKTNCNAGQQRALTVAVKRARHMALLPFVSDGRR
ncbi:MAG TPA: 30S ribosomal protein S18 [Thermomicrobiales bacterium]|nr:30S ribosomal protein S18 [Thermomicrobiales bacterium]